MWPIKSISRMWKQSICEVKQIAKSQGYVWFQSNSFYSKTDSVCFPPYSSNHSGCQKQKTHFHTICVCQLKTPISLIYFTLLNCTYLKRGEMLCFLWNFIFTLVQAERRQTRDRAEERESDRAQAVRNVIRIISSRDFKWSNILAIIIPISKAALSALLWKHIWDTLWEDIRLQESVSEDIASEDNF